MKRINEILKSIVLVISITATLITTVEASVDVIDVDTVSTAGKRMHICNSGLMSGLHIINDDLLCRLIPRIFHLDLGFDDYDTTRLGMHACPYNTVMMGIHVQDNVLKCSAPATGTLVTPTEYIDSNTIRGGMHACPAGWVMTGVHAINDQLLCTQYVP